MCDPVTLLVMGASAAATAVGTGVSMSAAKSGAAAGKASADIDAAVASFNADLLHDEAEIQRAGADLPIAAGALAERRLRRTVDATLGSQVARFAAAGVDASVGSPLLAQMYTAQQGELDAGIIRARARRERANILVQAANTDVQGTNAEWQAIGARVKGENAIAAGRYGAASALVGGVSKWIGLAGSAPRGGGGGVSVTGGGAAP